MVIDEPLYLPQPAWVDDVAILCPLAQPSCAPWESRSCLPGPPSHCDHWMKELIHHLSLWQCRDEWPYNTSGFFIPKTSFFSVIGLVQNVSLTSVRWDAGWSRGPWVRRGVWGRGPSWRMPLHGSSTNTRTCFPLRKPPAWSSGRPDFIVPCEHNCEDRFLVRDHLQEPFSTTV